ncbi:MAG: hypothetical protein WCG95_09630 [bacterium]
MLNFLIVIIIAIVIWMINPLAHFNPKSPTGVDKKTINEVNQVQNEAIRQVNQARQMQQEQQESLDK